MSNEDPRKDPEVVKEIREKIRRLCNVAMDHMVMADDELQTAYVEIDDGETIEAMENGREVEQILDGVRNYLDSVIVDLRVLIQRLT